MSDLFHTKWFWGLLCLVFGCTLSFQMGQQYAAAENNSSGAQFEQFLGRLDAATRQKVSDKSNQDSPSDSTTASINEIGR